MRDRWTDNNKKRPPPSGTLKAHYTIIGMEIKDDSLEKYLITNTYN
jgi:hypothetical protein